MRPKTTIGIILIVMGIIGLFYVYENGTQSALEKIRNFFLSEMNEQETYDVGDIQNLNIASGSFDVRLVQGSGSDAVVKLQGWASKNNIKNVKLNSDKKGDTLNISLKNDSGIRVGFGFSNIKLTVELPEKAWNELEIDINSGDVKLEQMQFNNAKIITGSGDVVANQFKVAHNLSVHVNSGDMSLRSLTAEKIDLETSSGDIRLKEYEAGSIDFKVNSGDVTFENGTAQLKGRTSSGDIIVKAEDIIRSTDLRTNSGDVTVLLENDPGSLAVQFKAGSGDGVIRKNDFTYEKGSKGASSIKGKFGSGEILLNVQTGSGDFVLK